jgi:exodeoxyribonuclease VIII
MHIMVDLETVSNKPNAAITQIGAAAFNIGTGAILKTFEAHVDLASAIRAGGAVEADTIVWWLGQDAGARSAFVDGQNGATAIGEVLQDFIGWCKGFNETLRVWSNGASFDVPIIEVAMSRFGLKPPWKFWDVLDVRTVAFLCGCKWTDLAPPEGTGHKAVDDAVRQAKAMAAGYKLLTVKP